MEPRVFRDKVPHGDSTDHLGAPILFFVLLKQITRGQNGPKTMASDEAFFFSNDGKLSLDMIF
jgi:hypothetical protein